MRKSLLSVVVATSMMAGSIMVNAQELRVQEPFELPEIVAETKEGVLKRDEFLGFIDFVTDGHSGMLTSKEQAESLVEAYLLQKGLAEAAIKKGLDKEEAFLTKMEQIKLAALAESALIDFSENLEISEEELRKEYEAQISGIDKEEYEAAHILVEEREEAEKIIAALKEGKITFGEAAKEHSIDPGSAAEGGDLGWFRPQMMVTEFSDAVAKMKVGEISEEPIESQFGFHIIQLNDQRETELESFENARDGLEQLLLEVKMRDYLEELNDNLEIDYKF